MRMWGFRAGTWLRPPSREGMIRAPIRPSSKADRGIGKWVAPGHCQGAGPLGWESASALGWAQASVRPQPRPAVAPALAARASFASDLKRAAALGAERAVAAEEVMSRAE